jgi:outer membrane protein assembly factor BamB/4-amino-4-deoxy-L-arabinose transferase-like glycosyltransferase
MKLYELNEKIMSLYRKYIALDFKKRLLILAGLALFVRLLFVQQLTMELDTYFYAKQAQDIKTAIVTGTIFSNPVNHQSYYGIEYRSPLYTIISGFTAVVAGNVEASLIIVSLLAGILLLIPVFLMARSFWGDPAGDIAALFICFYPQLIMHSTMGRTESLYIMLYTFAVFFTIRTFENGRWQFYLYSGLFWGLAYQTRFESLAGILATVFLLAYTIFRKKKDMKAAKGFLVFIVCLFLVILPYILLIYNTSGELSLTSPSKKSLDMSESLWITSGKEGSYYTFNYFYGDPGEYNRQKLKALIPQNPDVVFEKNLNLFIPAIIKAIPTNIWLLLSNFNLFLLLILILPVLMGWKMKDPGVAISWMYSLTAFPIILLSFWSPDPRYYAYLIPLAVVNGAGIIKQLGSIDGNDFSAYKDSLRTCMIYILIPASLFLSWYFSPGQTLIQTWLSISWKPFAVALHQSLVILLFLFGGLVIAAAAFSVIWKRIPYFLFIPAFGMGVLTIAAGFVEPRVIVPAQIEIFIQGAMFETVRSVIVWLFAVGIIYEIFIYMDKKIIMPDKFKSNLITASVIIMFVLNIQNMTAINTSRSSYRYFNYHERAVKAVKNIQKEKVSVMCRHPHDAFALGGKWIKTPPLYDFGSFTEAFNANKPQYIIVDDLPLFEGNFMSVYPFFQVLKAKGQLSLIDYYEKNDVRFYDKKIRVWVYKVQDVRTSGKNGNMENIGAKSEMGCLSPALAGIYACPVPVLKFPLAALEIWQSFRNNSLNNGRTPFKGPGKNARIKWKYKAGHEIFSSPAIALNGVVVFGCDDSNLYAIKKNGKLLWKYAADYYVSASPSISRYGFIYFGCDDQRLYSLSPDGKLRWGFHTGYFISSGVKFMDKSCIVFGGEDKYVYCLSSEGQLKWKYKTNGEITATPAVFTPNIYSTGVRVETVVIPSHDGFVYAISNKGNLIWKYKAGSEILSSPAIDDSGNIFICDKRGRLTALSSDGKKKWIFRAEGEIDSSPAVTSDGSIVFGCKDHHLYKISSGGKLLWKFKAGYDIESSPAVDSLGNIYFGSHDRNIYGINAKGKLLWKIETGGAVYSSPAISSDGTLYVGSMDKYLYAVTSR